MTRLQRMFIFAPLLVALFFASGFSGRASLPQPRPDVELTVSAAISLKDSLDEIAKIYHTETPEATIHFNYGASGTLQRQVEEGAPVDLFVSASPNQMDALESKSLVLAGTRKDLVRNSIVLIVPKGKAGVSSFQDLAKPEAKIIAVGEPQSVPAGKYAQEVLTHLGLYDQLKPKFVLAKDVRQVLTYVASGNADAGIVYATDAKTSSDVAIIATAPEDSHSPVIYPIAVLRGSQHPEAAKQLEEFLLGPRARDVFQKYGFIPAN
jgi:molybdate transport system substrate-binding protein